MDSLYRFFQHDTAKTDNEPIWSVSSTRDEQSTRLYRILYKDIKSNIAIDIERTIPIYKYDKKLQPIFDILVQCLQRKDVCPEFINACKLLFLEDPWIQEFRENHPSIGA